MWKFGASVTAHSVGEVWKIGILSLPVSPSVNCCEWQHELGAWAGAVGSGPREPGACQIIPSKGFTEWVSSS
jgi:hypothetical protein